MTSPTAPESEPLRPDAQRQARRLAAIAEAQRALALSGDDEELITNQIAEMARRLLGGDGASYELVEDGQLRVRGVSGAVQHYIGAQLPLEGSLSGLAVREARSVRCGDVLADTRVHLPGGALAWRSKLATPLRLERRMVGVISVVSCEPGFFEEDDERALELLAESLGAVLQRRRHEEHLRESETQYRSLFADNPQPMFVYGPENGRILAVNTAAIAQYGYTEDEFVQLALWDLVPREYLETWREQVFKGPLLGTRRYECRHRRKSGEAFIERGNTRCEEPTNVSEPRPAAQARTSSGWNASSAALSRTDAAPKRVRK